MNKILPPYCPAGYKIDIVLEDKKICKKGNKITEISKEYDDNIKNPLFKGYYEDGIRKEGKEYDLNGTMLFDGTYKDGKREKGKEYNINGSLVFDGTYKDGKKDKGKAFEYGIKEDPKSHIKSQFTKFDGTYKDGYREKGKEYINKKGKIELIFNGTYKFGVKEQGKEYENGKLIFDGSYNPVGTGMKWTGEFTTYRDDGKFYSKSQYKDGQIVNVNFNEFHGIKNRSRKKSKRVSRKSRKRV